MHSHQSERDLLDHLPELSLVVPVFNGEATIEACLREWASVLSGLEYEAIVVDDGSTDKTPEHLSEWGHGKAGERFRVVRQVNAGHGPAVRKGYELSRGKWIFQADSDDEIEPCYFKEIWDQRNEADLVLAQRQGRVTGVLRRLVTLGEVMITSLIGNTRLWDPNVPFRLIRCERLREFCTQINPDEFAPNLLMSLWALRKGWRIVVVKLPHNPRHQSPRTLIGWKLVKGCLATLGGIFRMLTPFPAYKRGGI